MFVLCVTLKDDRSTIEASADGKTSHRPHGALAVTDRKKMHASTGRFEVAGVLDI